MTSQPSTSTTDRAFCDFLFERLYEEILAAGHRRETMPAGRAAAFERGLRLIGDVVLGLERGTTPDQATLDLLVYAYSGHPDFRREWNRWLA